MAFMPEFAPLVVLMFLGTVFALGITLLVIGYALLRRKTAIARYGVLAAVAGVGFYAGLLFIFGLASHERVLGPGEQKYFCEIDCHLAYSVESVTTAKTLGTWPNQKNASGRYYVVKVKTWFDPRTISSHRGNGPLTPSLRRVTIVDAQGREFELSADGGSALARIEGDGTPMTQPLRPGDSYTTNLVFDLPADASNPRLLITDADPIPHVLIGHELSPFHKKIYFAVSPQANSATL